MYHAKIRMALIAAQRIACGPLIAAAPAYGAVGCAGLPFGRLSNRALAATGGKCMCGPLGRRFFILGEHSTAVWCMGAAAGIEVQAIRCGTFLRRDCKRTKGIPKTMGLWRRFCILLPPWAKGCRAGARNIPTVGMKEKRCGPSGTPAPTGASIGVRNSPAGSVEEKRCGPSRRQPLRGASIGARRRIRTGKEKIIS